MSAQLEAMVQCCSWELFSVEVPGSKPGVSYMVTHGPTELPAPYMYGFRCTCPAYKFSPGPVYPDRMEEKTCKHIEAVMHQCCLWHQQFDGERYQHDGKCPRCGGPVMGVIVAV